MPHAAGLKLPPPRSWDDFEDMVADVVRKRWVTPHVSRNGRSGQGQAGVDVFGLARHLNQQYAGAQCKNVERLAVADVREAAELAESFVPTLCEFLIATTLPRDASLQTAVRVLNMQRLRDGKFPVEILFWDDVFQDLATDRPLLAKYFPDAVRLIEPDPQPRFDVQWIVDAAVTSIVEVPGAARDLYDFIDVLDLYDAEELEYLHAHAPADAALAREFNTTAFALSRDPVATQAWRASRRRARFDCGHSVGIMVTADEAEARSVKISFRFPDGFEVFRADSPPANAPAFDLPIHPRLASEQRYSDRLANLGMFTTYDLRMDLADARAFPSIRVARQVWLRAAGTTAEAHINVMPPRRPVSFAKDDAVIVVAAVPEGELRVDWTADSATSRAPQHGSLTVKVTRPPRPADLGRRGSYIGPALAVLSRRDGE